MKARWWAALLSDAAWLVLVGVGAYSVLVEQYRPLLAAVVVWLGASALASSVRARQTIAEARDEVKIEKKENTNDGA